MHPAAIAAAALALLVGLPTPGRGADTRSPAVDLQRMSLTGESAAAPIVGGGTARLSLDPDLQRTSERLLSLARPVEGAVVLVDVASGGLLVWAEYVRSGRSHGEVLTQARAPSASLFKIVTTAALLEKRVSPKRQVCWSGGQQGILPRHLSAPTRADHPHCAPFGEALGFSRNAVYAQLVTRFLDAESLGATARRMGFGNKVPLDVDAEVGHLALPEGSLEFARAATGFQDSTLSPVGAAHLLYTVALRGRPGRMHLVEQAGAFTAPERRQVLGRVLSEPVAYELRKMLEGTVHAGTSLETFTNDSGRSYLGSVRVAGKTGTLQETRTAPTSTWFVGFAPSNRPAVVVSVLVRNGPVWRRKANAVARDVLRAYFFARGRRGVTEPFGETAAP